MAVGDDPFARAGNLFPNLGLQGGGIAPGIFETLTKATPSFGLAPGLALRWEALSPSMWRFTLRRGVTFHDGTAFKADSVVSTLVLASNRANKPRGLDSTSAKAVSDDVVEVNLSLPNLRFAEQMANTAMGIQAAGTQAGNGDTPASTPTGTGPFQFESYAPDSQLRVVANPRYREGPPRLRSITFRFSSSNEASRLLAAGQVDAVSNLPDGPLPSPKEVARVATSRQAVRSSYLLMNVQGTGEWATLKGDAVRQAVARALDRQAITRIGWPGLAEPSRSVIPPAVLGSAGVRVRAPLYDLGQAGAILDHAGWIPGTDGIRQRDGKRLSLTLLTARRRQDDRAVEAIRAQLAQAGIAVVPLDLGGDGGARQSRVNQTTFDLFLDERGQDDANPCSLCRLFSTQAGGQLSVSAAVGGGPRADELFDRVHAEEIPETVRSLAVEMMGVVTSDQTVVVPLAALRSAWLASPRVQGFEPPTLPGAQPWHEVWLSR